MNNSCTRCGGEGWLTPRGGLPDGGICYRCYGTGVEPDPSRDIAYKKRVQAKQAAEKEHQKVVELIVDIYLVWKHERSASGEPNDWSTFRTGQTLPDGIRFEDFKHLLSVFESRESGRLPERTQSSASDEFQQEQERRRAIEGELAEKRKQDAERIESERVANLLVEEGRQRALRHLFQAGEIVSQPYYGVGMVLVAHPWHLSDRCGQLVKVKFADGSERELRSDAAGLRSVGSDRSPFGDKSGDEKGRRSFPHVFKVGENVTHPFHGRGVIQVAHPWRPEEAYGQLVKVKFGDGSEKDLRVALAGLESCDSQ